MVGLVSWLNRSHVWMAVGAACLASETFLINGYFLDPLFLLLVAALTWLAYFFLKWNEWRGSRRWAVVPLTIVLLLLPGYFHWYLLIVLLLVLTYDLKWLPQWKNKRAGLRYLWFLKPIVIVLCWTILTNILPQIFTGNGISLSLIQWASSCAFILSLSLAGDVRDRHIDIPQYRTISHVIGVRLSLVLIVVLMCTSFVLLAVLLEFHLMALAGLAFVLTALIALKKVNDWHVQTFWLDALLPLRLLIVGTLMFC